MDEKKKPVYEVVQTNEYGDKRWSTFPERCRAFEFFNFCMKYRDSFCYYVKYGEEILAIYSDNQELLKKEVKRLYG